MVREVRCELGFPEREATKRHRVFFRAHWAMKVHYQPDSGTFDLRGVVHQAMIEHGFEPDFPLEAEREVAQIKAHPSKAGRDAEDLRHRLSSSIDNDKSRDLDQIEFAERLSNGGLRVLIGITGLHLFVLKDSAIDRRAAVETVTLYSGIRNWSLAHECVQNHMVRYSGSCLQ
jgi:hypothetical protein